MMPGTFLRHTGVGLEGGLRYEPKVAMADGFLSAVKKKQDLATCGSN